MAPDYFADHIGNLTVELVLATVEISTLIVHTPPTLEALLVLQESEAFPGHEPEGKGHCCARAHRVDKKQGGAKN